MTAITELSTTLKEQVGAAFDIRLMAEAQRRSWAVLRQIAAAMQPGMTEAQAREEAKHLLEASGVDRLWHPVIIRFGVNTCKTYQQPSEKNVVLAANDIFFIDLGPVYAGHEGDVGDTFVLGDDAIKLDCAVAAGKLFQLVRQYWLQQQVSGAMLYQYAQQQADNLGYQLNLDIKGHRLGDFPHKLYNGGNLADFTAAPTPGVWVLEIQLRHPTLPIGAFYEDVLLRD